MIADRIGHLLSFSVRIVDHFTRAPVADEFPVRLAGSFQRPVFAPGGRSRRQHDGTYRFIDVRPGPARLLWRSPFERLHGSWRRWGDEDPQLQLPLPDPRAGVEVEVWPVAEARTPVSATAVRGKLTGSGAAGQRVRITAQGAAFDRYTCSDERGEFLFPLLGAFALDGDGLVPLSVDVLAPDGTARALAGGRFIPEGAGTAFAGSAFTVRPRTVSRIVFRLV